MPSQRMPITWRLILVLTGLDANFPPAGRRTTAESGRDRRMFAGEAFFRENKAHFWGLLETRFYMRARQELADAIRDVGLLQDVRGQSYIGGNV